MGFLTLLMINGYLTLICIINLMVGGGDLKPLITGWINWKYKVAGILWFFVMIYCWYVLYIISPFTIGLK